MYSTKFVESGYDVDVADGSAAVLSKLQEGKQYDLIILDMVMPGTSGVELLTIIREQFPEQTKCCIFLSNQGQDEDIREATEAGAVGYIIKAESIPSEVVKKVEVILKKCKK
jgi:CheY-like chemotaxis protein